MARLTHDHHLDAALRLILDSFQYAQEQGRLTDTEIAGTFLGLLGQLEYSSQLTPAQHALCREMYVLVARRATTAQPVPPLPTGCATRIKGSIDRPLRTSRNV